MVETYYRYIAQRCSHPCASGFLHHTNECAATHSTFDFVTDLDRRKDLSHRQTTQTRRLCAFGIGY